MLIGSIYRVHNQLWIGSIEKWSEHADRFLVRFEEPHPDGEPGNRPWLYLEVTVTDLTTKHYLPVSLGAKQTWTVERIEDTENCKKVCDCESLILLNWLFNREQSIEEVEDQNRKGVTVRSNVQSDAQQVLVKTVAAHDEGVTVHLGDLKSPCLIRKYGCWIHNGISWYICIKSFKEQIELFRVHKYWNKNVENV